MNSFDFFDTLVARKSVVDKRFGPEEEKANLFPIKEIVNMVKPEDIIISDYDYPEVVQWGVKNICGLDNKVVVTQDGKLTGEIWKQYRPNTHYGDSLMKDIKSAEAAGIQGLLCTESQYTTNEYILIDLGWESIAKCVREARLRTFNPKYRKAELLQIEYNFPLLLAASVLIDTLMREGQFKRLLLCSRDCNLWYSLMGELAKIYPTPYEIYYFYTSRVARLTPSISYLDYVNNCLDKNTVITDLCGYGESLPKLLEKTKFPDTPIWILGKYGHPVPNRSIGLLKITNSYIERLNVAMHPKVIDVLPENNLVFSNKGNIDWHSPRIAAMHNAFSTAVSTLKNYELNFNKNAEIVAKYILEEVERYHEDVLEEDVVLQEAFYGE